MANPLTLYSYWRSSSSWRVRLALEHKSLDYAYEAVHLVRDGGHQHFDDHTARNASHQVPTLAVGDGAERFHISQSVAIMEYLEEVHPTPSLLPDTPRERAITRQLVEIINSGTQPLQNLAVIQHLRDDLGVDARAFCRRFILKGLQAYEATCAPYAGKFSVGDTVTMADFCLIPQLYNARRFKLDLEPFDTLLAIEQACASLPAFEAAHPDAQPDFDPDAPA